MNMRADFDTFAAELLDQIEAVQTLSRALTATNVVAEMPFNDSADTRKPAVEMTSLLEMPAAWQHHDKEF